MAQPSPSPSPITTEPDKYKVIFENERVRVFDYKDIPSQKTKMHHHKEFVSCALGPFKRKLPSVTTRPQ